MSDDPFDVQEWLEDARGEELRLTPKTAEGVLGPHYWALAATREEEKYCRKCDAFRMLIESRKCPACGHEIGMLERGLSKEDAEEVRVVKRDGMIVTEERSGTE